MRKAWSSPFFGWILVLIFVMFSLAFSGDAKEEITIRYFSFLNNLKFNQAKTLTDSAFVFESFEGRIKSRDVYFEEFSRKRLLHPFTEIVQILNYEDHIKVFANNSTDYSKYLGFDALPIQYHIYFNDLKINRIYYDSLPGYNRKLLLMKLKLEQFKEWIAHKHPNYLEEYSRNGYMKKVPELLQQFSRQKTD